MNTKDLITIWGAPESPRLTPKQISIRLPITVSAKISALCELYPRKPKSEIIGDLLNSALDELENNLPYKESDEQIGEDRNGDPIYSIYGMRTRFQELTEKYLRALEEELGITESDTSKQQGTGQNN